MEISEKEIKDMDEYLDVASERASNIFKELQEKYSDPGSDEYQNAVRAWQFTAVNILAAIGVRGVTDSGKTKEEFLDLTTSIIGNVMDGLIVDEKIKNREQGFNAAYELQEKRYAPIVEAAKKMLPKSPIREGEVGSTLYKNLREALHHWEHGPEKEGE